MIDDKLNDLEVEATRKLMSPVWKKILLSFYVICSVIAVVFQIAPQILWPKEYSGFDEAVSIFTTVLSCVGAAPLFACLLALPVSLIPISEFKYQEKFSATASIIATVLIPFITLVSVANFSVKKQVMLKNLELHKEK